MKYLTSKQMAKIDKLAMEKYGIKIEQMMENAGRNLADFVSNLNPKKVMIFFGKGNNGGGGLVSARYLSIKGIKTEIIAASPDNNENVKNQLSTLKQIGIIPVKNFKFGENAVVIDALLGYNIKGNPRGKYKQFINKINSADANVVSLDLPSGINPDTGEKFNPYVKSDYVLALALPKTGLKNLKNVYLGNIGIPNQVFEDLGMRIKNYFKHSNIIKI